MSAALGRRLGFFFALVALLVCPRAAWAKGPVEIRPLVPGPLLELVPDQGAFSAKVALENPGPKPIKVEVRLRDSAPTHPRLPPGLSAKIVNAGSSIELAPGQKREVVVELVTPRGRRIHEQYGHVLFFVGEEPRPLAMGFHLALPGAEWGLSGHLLSLLIGLPLVAGIVLLILRGRELWAGSARAVVGGTAIAQLLVLAWISSRFDASHTRFLGTDGLQLMERLPLIKGAGVEGFLALDGISLTIGSVVPALGAVVAFAYRRTATLAKTGGLMLLVDAGLMGALLSFDLAVLFAFWLLATIAAVTLVAYWDGRLARGLALQLGVGAVLVGAALFALSSGAQDAYWMDGTSVPRSFNLVELAAGGGWQPASTSWLGVHPIKLVYAALFIGCAITLGVPPFHGWTSALLSRAPAAPALLLVGGLPILGGYGLLRVGYAALPTGTAWAAPGIAAFAAVAAVWAALALWSARERSRALASSAALHSAVVLVGLSSLTVAGLQGVLIVLLGRTLWVALLTLLARAPSTPLLAVTAAVGFAAIAGAPGTLGFVGDVAVVAGALPTRKLVGLVLPFVLVLGAVGVARFFRRSSAEADAAEAGSELDERVPVALALCLVGLGVWPRPLTGISEASCLDQAEYANPPGVLEIASAPAGAERRTAQLTGYSTAGSANENDTLALRPLSVE